MIMFAYGHDIDACDEYCKLGELISMVSLKGFVVGWKHIMVKNLPTHVESIAMVEWYLICNINYKGASLSSWDPNLNWNPFVGIKIRIGLWN
jgi:hypothetical protein